MNNFIKSLVFVLSSVLFYSCSFATEKNIDVAPGEKVLAVYFELFNDANATQSATISRTRNIGEVYKNDVNYGDTIYKSKDTTIINQRYGSFDSVMGARVRLIKNGQTVKSFTQNLYNKGFFNADNIALTEGETYSFEVSAPNFTTATASQTVPRSVKLTKAVFSKNTYQSKDNGTQNEIVLDFNDPAGEENFYGIDVFSTYQQPKFSQGYFAGVETIQYLSYRASLTDVGFDGKAYTYRVPLYYSDYYQDTSAITANNPHSRFLSYFVKFRTISKDVEKYQSSVRANTSAVGDPFREPTTTFTNFDNGLGLFTISGKADTLTIVPK